MFRAFLGLVIQGVACANFTTFVNNLSSLCYQAYCNPNPQARLMILQTINGQIRGAFASVPPYQHDQLASNIMSSLASYPFSANELRRLGPQECSRHFPVFAPVINAMASVLGSSQSFDDGYFINPQPPQRATLPRFLESPSAPRANLFDASIHRPEAFAWDAGATTPRPSPPPLGRAPPRRATPPSRNRSNDTPTTGRKEPARDSLEAPSGLESETRKIRRLKDIDRTAYNCAVEKLERAHSDNSEGNRAREWIKKFVQLPLWETDDRPNRNYSTAQQQDRLREARRALDDTVVGHDEAKTVLLGRYAMWLRNPEGPGMVLGIQGPPGNGKTTLVAHGLSSVLGRPAEIIDMGGIRDAQILRGDRALWVGASCGRVADCLMRTGTRRLILILEEIDKVHRSGEVQHVLSNLTDPNRNSGFEDSYFSGVPLDLSKAVIICTFNDTSSLDSALVSRMGRIIETSGLSSDDKIDIARRFLIPKALKDARRQETVTFNDQAVSRMVELSTGDPGARQLKSYVERVVGAVNVTMIEGGLTWYTVTVADVQQACASGRTSNPPALGGELIRRDRWY